MAANGTRVMIVDDGFAEGMSGGPVTDGDGRVVGVAIGIEVNSKVGIVTPTSGLRELLAGAGDPAPATRLLTLRFPVLVVFDTRRRTKRVG